jgi:hypothetical protein
MAGKAGTTIIKTVPSSMINMAKPGIATVTQGAGGKQTIVIAAPKSGMTGATPTKIITTVPKLSTANTSGTQFIVVTTRAGGQTSNISTLGSGGAGQTQIINTSGGKQIITIVTTASALHGALAGASPMVARTVTSSLTSAVRSAPIMVTTRPAATLQAIPQESAELTEAALAAEQLPMQVDGMCDEYFLPQLDGAGDQKDGAANKTQGVCKCIQI